MLGIGASEALSRVGGPGRPLKRFLVLSDAWEALMVVVEIWEFWIGYFESFGRVWVWGSLGGSGAGPG